MTSTIEFELLDYWHCGAGHGSGRYLDAVVSRTPAGLPCIPGRTVKGLLRDVTRQAEAFGHLEAGTTEALFGSALPDGNGADRFSTSPGSFRVGDARLPGEWEAWASTAEGRGVIGAFFDVLSTTSLDETRVAQQGTLRRIEVAVPCTLRAHWEADDPDLARRALEVALPLLRRLGSSRHRGLGRVHVQLGEE